MAFFADTNVCSAAARDPELLAKLQALSSELREQGHEYAICPLVLLELIEGLATPEPKYFATDQRRFRVLTELAQPRYLAFPGSIAMKAVFGVPSAVTRFTETDFAQWLSVVTADEIARLHAATREVLREWLLKSPSPSVQSWITALPEVVSEMPTMQELGDFCAGSGFTRDLGRGQRG